MAETPRKQGFAAFVIFQNWYCDCRKTLTVRVLPPTLYTHAKIDQSQSQVVQTEKVRRRLLDLFSNSLCGLFRCF